MIMIINILLFNLIINILVFFMIINTPLTPCHSSSSVLRDDVCLPSFHPLLLVVLTASLLIRDVLESTVELDVTIPESSSTSLLQSSINADLTAELILGFPYFHLPFSIELLHSDTLCKSVFTFHSLPISSILMYISVNLYLLAAHTSIY